MCEDYTCSVVSENIAVSVREYREGEPSVNNHGYEMECNRNILRFAINPINLDKFESQTKYIFYSHSFEYFVTF